MSDISAYIAILMRLNGRREYRAFNARVTCDERGETLYLTSGNFGLEIDLKLILDLLEEARRDRSL